MMIEFAGGQKFDKPLIRDPHLKVKWIVYYIGMI